MDHRQTVEECWSVELDCSTWLPSAMVDWLQCQATKLGVADSYLAFPLFAMASYCSQHAFVKANEDFFEPTALYFLVGGRSGTNKSGALRFIRNLIRNLESICGVYISF